MENSIYLVRHGQTQANIEDRFAGRTAEPLIPQGIEQMQEVGTRLQPLGIAAIYCGPLPRVVQSAEILGEKLGVPIKIEEAFNDISIPHWEGKSKQEIHEELGGEYPDWLKQPESFKLPGCESLVEVQNRAVDALKGIMSSHAGEKILLVSNLIVLRCLVLHYQQMELKDFRSIKIDNGTIISLTPNAYYFPSSTFLTVFANFALS